ncbi:MAG: TraR/DksA family transcriptional regulator [Candidatus Binataceae bacterium]
MNCEECGEPISEKRLEAMPGTRLCVRCQERKEWKAKQPKPVEKPERLATASAKNTSDQRDR